MAGVKQGKKTRFWNILAGTYSRQPIADEASYQEKLRITREYLTRASNVLEFGSGTGSTAILHAPYAAHILGIDFSEKMIAIADRKARDAGVTNVDFEVADIDDLSIPDNTYDAVMGMSILHLLDNRVQVIAKVHAMLKPGGVFISSTTCVGDSAPFLRMIFPFGKLVGLLPTLNFLTPDQLEADLISVGFEIAHKWQPNAKAAVFCVARKKEQ